MNRPEQPYATQPTPEDWARFHAEVAPWYAAGHRLADEHDPRPESERTPHVSGGGALGLLLCIGGALVFVGAFRLLLVALDAIAGTL